ncbi:hypothetical protein B9T33_09450 [Acinetobacter sp. ANC 5054]|uniref:hypothetical protein n=1 Tax=Acinetobacter sp. ANC 5054 TaxID=1977877 RepID=UPI000A35845E|nr:hypothetical protein [Acinetobacter sp. ANC 5054]OTG80141.1 hypothetical protein B9T33_09450 [Acinetobacter sp. ANC 5054]
MKIKAVLFLICYGFSNIQNAKNLPTDFYMKETYKKFLRTDLGESYSIEKKVNNNFSAVIEIFNKKNNKIIEKYENKYINPLVSSSYNDYYQISKKYEYNEGVLLKTSYFAGNSENCFVKCDNETIYNKSRVYSVVKYPSCISLFDLKKRELNYNSSYVKEKCIEN